MGLDGIYTAERRGLLGVLWLRGFL